MNWLKSLEIKYEMFGFESARKALNAAQFPGQSSLISNNDESHDQNVSVIKNVPYNSIINQQQLFDSIKSTQSTSSLECLGTYKIPKLDNKPKLPAFKSKQPILSSPLSSSFTPPSTKPISSPPRSSLARKCIRPNTNSSPVAVTSVIQIDDDEDGDEDKSEDKGEEATSQIRSQTKKKSDAKMKAKVILIYPSSQDKDKIQIFETDLSCLDDMEFLNDNVVCFFVKLIKNELIPKQIANSTHFFDPLFYTKLSYFQRNTKNIGKSDPEKLVSQDEKIYNRVQQFCKSCDICSKDFIVVPVVKDHHWWLAIICYASLVPVKQAVKVEQVTIHDEYKKPCILFMDSMHGASKSLVKNPSDKLRSFLLCHFKEKIGKEYDFTRVLNTAFSDSATALKCLSFINTAGHLPENLAIDEVQNLGDDCLQFLLNSLGNSYDANVDANANVNADANLEEEKCDACAN